MSTADLIIRAGQGDYAVRFLQSEREIVSGVAVHASRLVVMDAYVAELYPQLYASLRVAPMLLVAASEEEKSLKGVQNVLEFLQQHGADRRTVVVAVGGGIVQDIVTVAAHLYYRGLRWVYVPTTLLSMADSCIGSKGAVNLGEFKNQVGAFHAPSEVLVWLPFIETLHTRDRRSGYGEVLKLHIIGGDELFASFERDLDRGGLLGPSVERHVRASLAVKQRVIEVDEYERDLRRILNYGHTFGHALEAITAHEIPHGLAVAWGVDVANYIAMRLGMLTERVEHRIRSVVDRFFREPLTHQVSAGALVEAVRRDKKAASGSINLVLPEQLGRLRVVSRPLDSSLEHLVAEYLDAIPLHVA
jgi:3-dehydroquinate synthase